jgi:hypothetical protein
MLTTVRTNDRVDDGGSSYYHLSDLADGELLANTRRLVGESNQILAALLAHLAEVETRGIHRSKACSSLYMYCIYELRFSEDAASRRVCAARLVKRFPALLQAIANGQLHLTGLLMLGPYFTPQNQLELLARAQFRTKKELTKLVRILDPLPDVPAQIVPLGPAPAPAMTSNASPNWQSFAHSLCPKARELAPGDRPGDWANETLADDEHASEPLDAGLSPDFQSLGDAPARDACPHIESLTDAPAREEAPTALTAPQRFQVQFTASEEHVELVERARALLSLDARNGGELAEIHLRAMRTLVAELEKHKYGAPQRRPSSETPQRRQPAEQAKPTDGQRKPHIAEASPESEPSPTAEAPRQRVRHIPAAERRAVFERDGARCNYVDAQGQRCRETRFLELHHLTPFARGGGHVAANLAIFCRAHNTLAAEEDFSRKFVQTERDKVPHESWAAQKPP